MKFILILPALLLFSAVTRLHAAQPVIVDKGLNEIHIGNNLEILEDRTRQWSFEEVNGGKVPGSFKPSKSALPSFGYTSSAYWVRFRAANPSPVPIDWYLELAYPHIDRIELYVLDQKGKLQEKRRTGDMRPFSSREKNFRNYIFRLKEEAKSERGYLMRFESSGAMNLFLVAWNPEKFSEKNDLVQIAYGIFYGAILIMIFYNIFLFFSIREVSYLYYVLYSLMFFMMHFSLSGFAYQYLWPRSVWWTNNNLSIFILLTVFFSILFSREFLNLKEQFKKADQALLFFLLMVVILLAFSLAGHYQVAQFLSLLIVVLASLLLLFISIKLSIARYRPAFFYLIAWTAFWAGSILYALKFYAMVPDNFVTRWSQHGTFLIQLVLLSLGLADRINLMKRQLEGMNVNLEVMVQDRTKELNRALKDKERKEREINIEYELTGYLQQGILPQMPFYFEGVKIEAFYKSMGKVGGDFFDIFHMKGGYLGILIADASGHGMPAAFITALAKISFSEAIQGYLFPADIFIQVNNELVSAIKTDDFVTAFLLVVSPTFEVFYGNASHQKAIVLRRQGRRLEEWDTNGLFLGAMAQANQMYQDGQDMLDYGDRLLLYTDGVTDAKNAQGENFRAERLKDLLEKTADMPLDLAKVQIVSEWQNFTMDMQQIDDATMVLIEIDPAYKELIERRERGFHLLWEKKYAEAIEELNRALAINDLDEKAHLYIGECYLKNGNYDEAIEHLQQYLKRNEVDANVWFHIASAYFSLGNFPMAHKSALMSTQLRNNFTDAMVICARSLKAMDRGQEALKFWRRILSFDPENGDALKGLEEEGAART